MSKPEIESSLVYGRFKAVCKEWERIESLYPDYEDFFWGCWYGIWSGQVCGAGLEEGKDGSNRGNWITRRKLYERG